MLGGSQCAVPLGASYFEPPLYEHLTRTTPPPPDGIGGF